MPDTATDKPVKMKTITVTRDVNGVPQDFTMQVPDTGDTLSWGPNDQHRLLNTNLHRVDGPVKATGFAVYTYDVKLPGMLYGRVLRSPYSRSNVKKLDLSPALKMPGVVVAIPVHNESHYEGEPVAAVAAVSPEIADDAIHAITVEYEQLPFVVTAEQAMKPGAPQVFPDDPEVENNVRPTGKKGDPAEATLAMEGCDAVVEAEYRTPVVHHTSLETHGLTVDFNGGDSATVYASTQDTFSIPADSARLLGLPRNKVNSVVQYMGGGFGAKFGIGLEGQIACNLAKEAKRPVKLMLTRKDEFLITGNRSSSWQKLKAGATKDGKLVAMVSTQYVLGGLGRGNLAGMPFVYKFPHFYAETAAIHTNIHEACAMRAPGHPEASFAMDSLMDELAYKLDMDPLEFRKNNLPDPYPRQMDLGAKTIGWEKRNKIPGDTPGPVKRGIGCSIGTWGSGGRPRCIVTVTIGTDGAVGVSCGSQDLGTGTRTYMRAIVAEELGLGMEDVLEQLGDSRLGAANGSGGSTTVPSLAPAVKDAAYNARQEFAKRIAPLIGAKPEDISFDNKQVAGGGKTLAWKEACASLPQAGISVQGKWQTGLSSRGAHGACFAEVEVDVETGHIKCTKLLHVQDIGLPLNRLASESQINGGLLMGMGLCLTEHRVMDENLGIMCNSSMMDYKIPGVMEIPEMFPIIDDGDTRQMVLGVGEPPGVPATAAIANAVFNACGVRIRDLPISCDKILMALNLPAQA